MAKSKNNKSQVEEKNVEASEEEESTLYYFYKNHTQLNKSNIK